MSQTIIEFIKGNYFFLLYFAMLALALFRYRQYFDSVLRYFPIFVGFTILTEVLGSLIKYVEEFRISSSEEFYYANNAIYNIYDWVFVFYFVFIFHKLIKSRKFKLRIKYGALLYLLALAVNPFFEDWIIFPQTIAFTIGAIVSIMSILLYFIDSRNRMNGNKHVLVWIGIGLLIFNLFFPPILIAGIYYFDFYQEFNLRQIHHILIVAMYGCFIIGFLQMKGNFTIKDT